MSKANKIFLMIFLLVLVLLTYLEASEAEPLNWNPSYSASDQIPLGSYVLFENLKENFEVERVDQPPYEYLTGNQPEGTYFFLNNHVQFDDDELDKVLEWVAAGNNLFIATDAFSKNLLDTLDLNTATAVPSEGISSKPMINMVHPDLESSQAYLYDHETYHSVFIDTDSLNHSILGNSQLFEGSREIQDPLINFLRTSFGQGEIYLHTTPQAFSNFFLLHQDNVEYIEKALGYLQGKNTLYWDSYYKTGKRFYTSPLYVLLSHKALRWAYYLLIISCILFVVFEGKRKQRSIPVLKPLENQTYNFTRTIAGLYLDRKDYQKIAAKKIYFFMDYIRVHYRIHTDKIDQEFLRDLAAQSGNSYEQVRDLFNLLDELQKKNNITKEGLLKLNSAIQTFKNNKNG